MLGIKIFFSLPQDPPAILIPLLGGLGLALWIMFRKSSFRLWVFACLLVLLGYVCAQYRTQSLAMPLIGAELHYRDIEGQIELLDPEDKKTKITIIYPTIEGLPPEQTPPRLRITLRGEQMPMQAGDRVRLKANLFPLPAPTMPGGFDFARYYYFSGIGGTGYSLSPVEILQPNQSSGLDIAINNLRHAIGEDMRNGMPGPAGAVAAAMTIGETGPISNKINDELRDSGLYHILSISGFHLAVVTGLVFAALRILLSLIPAFALRVNTKKIAGLLALLAAFAYLALAGYPLPAQRSFIMVGFVFVAILCDRRGISLRSMCFAALFILIAFPDSLYSASFQLSFAATLAIVSLYESCPLPRPQSLLGKAGAHALGILTTSLAASLATAPFIIYDFNRLSLLGIVSNMLVLPLASVVIMPAIIIAVLIIPLGIAWIAYIPVQWGTDLMLRISAIASAMPLASIRLPALSESGVQLAALGLLWVCLWRGRLRLWGIPMLLLSLATMGFHEPIDAFVSAEAKQVLVRLPDGNYTTLKGTGRSYAVKSWLQTEGQEMPIILKDTQIPCDETSCTYTKNGHTLIMVTHPESDAALDAACKRAPDILIASRYLKAKRCPEPKMLVGKNELGAYGPHAFRLKTSGIERLRTREAGSPRRQWQPDFDGDPDE